MQRHPPLVLLLVPLSNQAWLRCRYQQFKGALEKLDSKLASNSSLPIVYMWEHPMSGPVTKYAFCKPVHTSIIAAGTKSHREHPIVACARKDSLAISPCWDNSCY